MNVKEEINNFSDNKDKPILLWLLKEYHWSSQWRFVAKCSFKKYGNSLFQSHRV